MASTSYQYHSPQEIVEQHQEGDNTTTSEVPEQVGVLSAPEQLPAEMFYEIFQNVDKKSVQKSREVCRTWRNAIDNNPKLLKLFTFTIIDIKEFLGSELASKVKSVRFIQPLSGSTKSVEEFFIKIGSTVEEIFFTFEEPLAASKKKMRIHKQKLMFSMMIKCCTKLKRLTIASKDNNYEFIRDCVGNPSRLSALSMIQYLSVNITSEHLLDFRKFVLKLPNLGHLNLDLSDLEDLYDTDADFDDDDDYTPTESVQKEFIKIILKHLQQYNGKLQEISVMGVEYRDDDTVLKLLLRIGQLYPNTNINHKTNLNDLLNFDESEDFEVNKNTCRSIKAGYINFDDDDPDYEDDDDVEGGMDTSRIGFCSNLQYLDIKINQSISLVNLGFIKELNKLEVLNIKDERPEVYGPDFDSWEENDAEDNLNFMGHLFSHGNGIPSLVTLDFDSKELELYSFSLLHNWFPNLTKLYIRNYSGGLDDDSVYNLTNLEQLRNLTLENIYWLFDENLTRTYDFVEDGGKISNLPAIAGFKCLKHLQIVDCYELTDDCLTNGLALCNNLDKITLRYNERGSSGRGKFTRVKFFTGRFKKLYR